MTPNNKKYVHLHGHSGYSVRDATGKIDEYLDKVKSDGQNAMALTEHGNISSFVQLLKKSKALGINGILGYEAYCVKDMLVREKVEKGKKRANHLTLLCENNEGYFNLLKLASFAAIDGYYYTPRLDKSLLRKHSKGLICLSGCLSGDINQAILADDLKLAEELIVEYIDIFGRNNFFIEVMDNGFPIQKKGLELLPKLAKKHGLRVVATNDFHYVNKEDKIVQDALKAIEFRATLEENHNPDFEFSECWLKTANEMYEKFSEHPEWLEITQEIADRCKLDLRYDRIVFPEFVKGKEKKEELLAELCREGWKKNIIPKIKDSGKLKEYADRVKYEMGVINENDFTDYFLIVRDIVNFAKSKNIPMSPGRGSVGSCLVANLLGITDEEIDPIKYELYFERFLNPGRISPPDIDLDFADNRRQEVVDYVRNKYGKNNFVKTLTFNNFQAKQALRDSFKVYGHPIELQAEMANLVPLVLQGVANIRFQHLYGLHKDFPNALQPKLLEAKEKYPKEFWLAEKLEGTPRSAGTHASAYILADKEIWNYAPMDYDPKSGDLRSGVDMYSADEIKLLKMDFLGIETLAIVDAAQKLIKKRHGIDLDLKKIPLDDQKTWDLISKGDTIGIFQFESHGMRALLKKAKPKSLLELADCNAIYRPGAAKFIDEYCAVKAGLKTAEPIHPLMEPILKSTYGQLIYQESVIKMCQVLAGFDLKEADYMRKAIGKKKAEDMEKLFPMFENGCAKQGIGRSLVEKILGWFHDMSRYNFNKSHALAYALNAYRSAYVKAHYPLEFSVEMLNKNTAEVSEYMTRFIDAKNRGIKIHGPHINKSGDLAELINDEIYFGLGLVKGTNAVAVEGIIRERKNGPYKNYEDFIFRTYKFLEKTTLDNFILSGALDGLKINRKFAFGRTREILDSFRKLKKVSVNQMDMFALQDTLSISDKTFFEHPKYGDFEVKEKFEKEKEILGFYASGSPLDKYRYLMMEDNFYNTIQIASSGDDSFIEIIGVLKTPTSKIDKNGNEMNFSLLEDDYGEVRMVTFSKQYGTVKSLLKAGNILHIKARVSRGQLILVSAKKAKEEEE